MLWVNLIMDSFASLALATEDPNRPASPAALPPPERDGGLRLLSLSRASCMVGL
jgi:magnesium-transporting ATPase (P-type)